MTYVFLIAMSLVNIGSTVGFNAVFSLGVVLLMGTYGTPISSIFSILSLWRTISPRSLDLGQSGCLRKCNCDDLDPFGFLLELPAELP